MGKKLQLQSPPMESLGKLHHIWCIMLSDGLAARVQCTDLMQTKFFLTFTSREPSMFSDHTTSHN